jgi:hypothetical protein
MGLLLLHAGGWDELLLLGVAILVAFVIVRLAVRGSGDDPGDTPAT